MVQNELIEQVLLYLYDLFRFFDHDPHFMGKNGWSNLVLQSVSYEIK